MNDSDRPLDRATATEYASWFKALADSTRIQIVSLLARRGTPMNVGEIVAAVDVGQSTVSAHLRVLSDVRFVLAEHRGTATYYRINGACVDCFPTAADVVMARPVPAADHGRRTQVTANQTPKDRSARDAVVERYSGLARTALAGGAIADSDPDTIDDGCFGAAAYPDADGVPEAALRASLGCGNPVAVASLNPGETVLDLGSGGGLDVVLSARRVGPTGTAYGLDASLDMLTLARTNAAAAGVTNAIFLHGNIEEIPLPDEHVDVVISNCVLCLSADKPRVLSEAFRVLRVGGRLGISDVIADDDSPELAESEQWIGCVSLTEAQYRHLLLTAGFTTVSITSTQQASPGLQSAIIQAAKPAARA